MKFLLEKEE